MKKISVFLISALLLFVQIPAQAGFLTEQRAKIEQQKINRTQTNEIKTFFDKMIKTADAHDLNGIKTVYSKDFINSDGFVYDTYMKMIEDTWETYPDIAYSAKIDNIEFSNNYARVFVTETSTAAPKEQIGDFETVGELYSISKTVYHLEKHGTAWLVTAEDVFDEISTLKYGTARYVDIKLETPKKIGAGRYYTATLKVNIPEGSNAVASISREKIIYPQTKIDDRFRQISDENILERVFQANTDDVNEYAIASVALAQAKEQDGNLKVYMKGLAFIMTRVNVIPENKFTPKAAGEK